MRLVERINPEWCLSRVQHFMYVERENMEVMRELLELEELGEETRGIFVSLAIIPLFLNL
jgi:3-alpha domain